MRMQRLTLLALMMFFQYAIWGAWAPILSETLGKRLGASGVEIGNVFGVLWLACIITPFIGGQLVDRLMPSQVFLGIASIICAAAAWMMASAQSIGAMILWMWVWSLFYAPTLGITNSIAFFHLSKDGASEADVERDFSIVRTAGTIGWIVAALILSAYLTSKPAWAPGQPVVFEEMQLTAILGVIMAVIAFILPNTPPSKEVKDPWAFTKAFSLFRTVPGFTVFMIISFVVMTEFQFFYLLSAPFLATLGIPHNMLSTTKSVSQVAEIIALAVMLPLSLRYLGMRATLVIGVLAWPLRYIIFAIGQPLWLVIVSLMFHGIGFAFVFVTSQIYVDRIAPKDIRASAQSLLLLITLGFGNYLGTMFSGWLKDYYTVNGVVNWRMVFIVPAVMTIVCAIAYWFTFREPHGSAVTVEEVDDKAVSPA
jgi:nucleoside transporter